MSKGFFVSLLDILFPPLCHVCKSFIPEAGEIHICSSCRERLPPVESPFCSICGIPFTGAGGDHVCGHCVRVRPHFDEARSALVYEGTCRDLVHLFKYRNKTHLRRPLALLAVEKLTEYIMSRSPDIIVPVPLHSSRLRSRGFNQAVLLAEIVSRQVHVKLERDILRRVRRTEPQLNLTAEERRTNVKGAFSVLKPDRVRGLNILLVDDVMTTGSTVDECSQALKRAGVASVSVVTVARALQA